MELAGAPIMNDLHQVVGIAHKGGSLEHKQLAIEVSELCQTCQTNSCEYACLSLGGLVATAFISVTVIAALVRPCGV